MAGDGWPGMAPLAGIDSGPQVEVGNADSWLLAYIRENIGHDLRTLGSVIPKVPPR